MENIFTKLDKIVFNVLDRLDADDKNFVVKLSDNYAEKVAFSSAFIAEITVIIEKYSKKNENTAENPFNYSLYDFERALSKYVDSFKSTNEHFVAKLIGYFEKKYNLKIQDNYLHRDKINAFNKTPNTEAIVSFLFEVLGGISFMDMSKNNTIRDFQTKVSRYAHSLKGASVHFPNLVYVSQNWKRESEIESNSMKSIELLLSCISLFEFDCIENKTGWVLPNSFSMTFDPNEVIILRNCNKVSSIKIFKNGKVSVNFHESAEAAKFYDYFSLKNI